MYKRFTALIVSLCLVSGAVPMSVFARESTSEAVSIEASEDTISSDILDIASITAVAPKSVNDMLAQYKFTSTTGHGFAAERGNNLIDSIKGKNTKVVGDNNIKNGPDRIILNRNGNNVLIQDKYYSTARNSINACFDAESGIFRYIDGNGNPMIIEVPRDQYEEAIIFMKLKIQAGAVPGVTDMDEANKIVKKGALSYKQAKNLAKAGTIESLTYDSINGIVTSSCAFGISTVLNYAVNRMNGSNRNDAIKAAAKDGIITGGLVFGSYIIAAQLTKTGALKLFAPTSEAIVKFFGDKFAKTLISLSGEEATVGASSQALTKAAAKALRANILFSAVTTIVFTTPDAIDLFRGRISKEQFIKNFSVTAAAIISGTAGGFVGGAAGNLIAPGVGTVPGAFIGSLLFGTAGGLLADIIADHFLEDDAEEMYEMIQDRFVQLCNENIINEKEATSIADKLNDKLDEDMLKDMYQSDDREEFVDQMLVPLFEDEVSKREKLVPPTEEELRSALIEQYEGVVFIH